MHLHNNVCSRVNTMCTLEEIESMGGEIGLW